MANLNKVMLIGNVGKDSELRYMASGTPQATFSVAVNSNHRNKQTNEWESETEWFSIVVWGDTAERISQHVVKGKAVYVEGRLQTRSWETDGQKHYRTEVVAQSVQLLDRKPTTEARGGYSQGDDMEVDDLPY
jgi:single-strand DNA-binding protein